MNDNVFALKYRPRVLADLIGQEVPSTILKNSFGKWSSSYLVSGNMGSGKTSCGRIMAMSQNCQKGPTLTPCGQCKNCKDIIDGKSLDVIELDAASNRGIDEIRNIKHQTTIAPLYGRVKYIILDEVHALSGAGAEALLKILEEPPANVRFVLATTDPQLLKPTIHSRCISLHFSKIDWMDLFNLLKKVSDEEKLNIEEQCLRLISRISDGSARMCLQYLQSVRDFAGINKITVEHAQKVLNVIGSEKYFKLFDSAGTKNMGLTMIHINDVIKTSKKVDSILSDIHYHLRSLRTARLCSKDIQQMVEFGYTKSECQKYLKQAQIFNPIIVNKMQERLVTLIKTLEVNVKPQYFLEWFFQSAIIDLIKNDK